MAFPYRLPCQRPNSAGRSRHGGAQHRHRRDRDRVRAPRAHPGAHQRGWRRGLRAGPGLHGSHARPRPRRRHRHRIREAGPRRSRLGAVRDHPRARRRARIAILGSIATATYRTQIGAALDDVPPTVAAAARDTLAGALSVAQDLPAKVLPQAVSAFTDGLHTAANRRRGRRCRDRRCCSYRPATATPTARSRTAGQPLTAHPTGCAGLQCILPVPATAPLRRPDSRSSCGHPCRRGARLGRSVDATAD